MTMRSKQWYTKTSRLLNSFVKLSIGRRPPFLPDTKIIEQTTGGNQNFKYFWLEFLNPASFLSPAPGRIRTWRVAPSHIRMAAKRHTISGNTLRQKGEIRK